MTGWTIDTLKEYLLRLYEEHDHRHFRGEAEVNQLRQSQRQEMEVSMRGIEALMGSHLDANREAIEKAETAAERRFHDLNQFRETLTDQQAHLVTRVEMSGLEKRLQDLTDRVNVISGRGAGLNAGWQYMIALIGAASALVAIYMASHH